MNEVRIKDIANVKKTVSEHNEAKEALSEKVRKALNYTGWALSGVFSIVYIILLVIVILGFTARLETGIMLIIAIIGALFTFAISTSMMYQGLLFAKSNPEVNVLLKDISRLKAMTRKKKEKLYNINTYIIRSTAINLFFKALGIAVMSYCMINFTIMGIKDMMILWLGIANILMATGFGLIGMVSAYDTYIEKYVPTIKVIRGELEEQIKKPSGVDTTKEGDKKDVKD